jgi:hypothetical protein
VYGNPNAFFFFFFPRISVAPKTGGARVSLSTAFPLFLFNSFSFWIGRKKCGNDWWQDEEGTVFEGGGVRLEFLRYNAVSNAIEEICLAPDYSACLLFEKLFLDVKWDPTFLTGVPIE